MASRKSFDSVKMMREIRERLSKEFTNMTYQEQKIFIEKKIMKEGKWFEVRRTMITSQLI
jgi:hypothetical protein